LKSGRHIIVSTKCNYKLYGLTSLQLYPKVASSVNNGMMKNMISSAYLFCTFVLNPAISGGVLAGGLHAITGFYP
jgi:hypothetical protein